MSQWSFDDETEDFEGPQWVGNVRTLLLFVYPLVALGSAAFLVMAILGFNSYLINVPEWRHVFAAVLLAAAAKSGAFVWLGRRLRSHQDWHAKSMVNAVCWLAGPGVSLLVLPLSALLGAGLGEDVITTMIPEMGVAATISLMMR